MDMFYHEAPGPEREAEAAEYIAEFRAAGSQINGTGGLDRYTDRYADWLEKLRQDALRVPDGEKVPARTYFLIRERDSRIIGMVNIRLALNARLRRWGGHIGYSIRPSERGRGYNNINLYSALKICREHGIGTVLMDADLENPASWKTMEAMGGRRIRQYFDDEYAHCVVVDYEIDVEKALREHAEYEKMLRQPRD